jgi:hypothetical protein
MDKTARRDAQPPVDEEYEAAVDQYIAAMRQMAEEMADRQNRINQLQAETQTTLQCVFAELKIA